ncbi:unnamed protein product [Ixodes pacificus]
MFAWVSPSCFFNPEITRYLSHQVNQRFQSSGRRKSNFSGNSRTKGFSAVGCCAACCPAAIAHRSAWSLQTYLGRGDAKFRIPSVPVPCLPGAAAVVAS